MIRLARAEESSRPDQTPAAARVSLQPIDFAASPSDQSRAHQMMDAPCIVCAAGHESFACRSSSHSVGTESMNHLCTPTWTHDVTATATTCTTTVKEQSASARSTRWRMAFRYHAAPVNVVLGGSFMYMDSLRSCKHEDQEQHHLKSRRAGLLGRNRDRR